MVKCCSREAAPLGQVQAVLQMFAPELVDREVTRAVRALRHRADDETTLL